MGHHMTDVDVHTSGGIASSLTLSFVDRDEKLRGNRCEMGCKDITTIVMKARRDHENTFTPLGELVSVARDRDIVEFCFESMRIMTKLVLSRDDHEMMTGLSGAMLRKLTRDRKI